MRKHLAIFKDKTIERILNGQKTIETRFSQKRIPPFCEVQAGDIVYFKAPGEDIAGQFTVLKVIFFEGLTDSEWDLIRQHYQKEMSFGEEEKDQLYFQNKVASKYGTIIFIGQVEQLITSPITFKKRDHRGWVVLESER